jgi:aldehyde:ferredoxin oxidoreductase
MKGFTGNILHVNLSDGKVSIENPIETFYRKYLGGSCLGAYYLLKDMKPGIDALDPESILVFAIGPTTGAPVSGVSRHSVTGKSPLTGTICSSEAGGYWGPELKFAGLDAIVIIGKSSKPVYLWIHDGECELRGATQLWGKETGEAQDEIKKELDDDKIKVALIGPGGENLVNYACIVNELSHFNGRGGLGAVMGAKNLKAIAVRGTQPYESENKEKLSELAKIANRRIKNDVFWTSLREYGTHGVVDAHIATGGLPTNNWTAAHCEGAENLIAEEWRKDIVKKPGTCYACVQRCKRTVSEFEGLEPKYGGPEYETVGLCGTNLGIVDKLEISRINELCSRYTLDTVSFGATVGFAMECFEKGIITSEDTDGLELTFGNSDAVKKLVLKTALRKGFGNLLAKGAKKLAEEWGEEAEKLVPHTKGREFPAHMPQLKGSTALAYACLSYGADHCSSELDHAIGTEPISEMVTSLGLYETNDSADITLEKAKLFWFSQRAYSLMDTCCACAMAISFSTVFNFHDLVEIVEAATGWRTNLHELFSIGERRLHMFRAFNAREGFDSSHDILPQKLYTPLKDNKISKKNERVDKVAFENAKKFYYTLAGWDKETGNPSKDKLLEFGIEMD